MRDNKRICKQDNHKLVRIGDTEKCPHCLKEYPLIERGSRYGQNNSRTNTTQAFA